MAKPKAKAGFAEAPCSAGTWITDTLPDDEMTVLMRLPDDEYPVWPGFRDNDEWCSADGSTVVGPVLGWMHLEDAARLLDGRVPPNESR